MAPIGTPPGDHGAILHGDAAAAELTPAARRWTLVAAILGSSLAFMDGTVVNVALPAIQLALDATTADAQWVMEAYALFLSALLLVGGALGDRFGRRRIFVLGAIVFIACSLACALSRNASQLIAARAVQGIGAALLIPGSLAMISAAYPAGQRGKAIGTWSAFSAVTAAIGPVIGGFLIDHYSWTWAFLVNLPLGALLLAICVTKVPETARSDDGARVDVSGATFVTLGLAGIVFALIEAPNRGWSSIAVVASGGIGSIALMLFFFVEARSAAPMLPLAMFRNRSFAGANLLTLLLYAALGGGLFFFPLNLIQVQGYGATTAGAALLPFIVIMFALSRWAGTLIDVFGARLPLLVGPLIAAIGFALFAIPGVGANYWTTFFPAVCVLGLGMSITVAPLTTSVMNVVAPEHAGTASGVNNAVSRTAGLLAVAIFGIVLTRVFDARLGAELAILDAPPNVLADVLAQSHKLAGIVIPDTATAVVRAAVKHAIDDAFVAGFRWVMLLSAVLAVLSAVGAWLLIDGKAGAAPDEGMQPSGR